MDIVSAIYKLRDDIKTWVTNNINALNAKIDEKTIPIDSELDLESTNPIQNKAVASEIDDINKRVGETSVEAQISLAIASIDVPTIDEIISSLPIYNGEVEEV